jgi:anti-sigma regulatory factor (Ser/Thr protein kinase)
VGVPWLPAPDGMPRLLPVPSAWWETPAVVTRGLSARPEEARTARRFVRELLTCWGLEALADDAEMIVDELVVNAVLHGTRAGLMRGYQGPAMSVLRLCMLRRAGEVMLAVVDPGNDTPVPRQPNWAGESGRGLQIVGALSHVWGWSPIAGHGKAVWAVLRDP